MSHQPQQAGSDTSQAGDRFFAVDLHSHTHFSSDSATSPARLVQRAREVGLSRLAVTDHGEVDGALEASAIDPELIIVGEEIRCACGSELIGLYLKERIPYGLTIASTAEVIREQGGIVYVPHPFAYLSRVNERAEELLRHADIVESFNSRAFYPAWNRRALQRSVELGLPHAASSDAHFPWDVGAALTMMPEFHGPTGLLEAVRQGKRVHGRPGGARSHTFGLSLALTRRLLGRRPPFRPRSRGQRSAT